jgi:hypothetical protein
MRKAAENFIYEIADVQGARVVQGCASEGKDTVHQGPEYGGCRREKWAGLAKSGGCHYLCGASLKPTADVSDR